MSEPNKADESNDAIIFGAGAVGALGFLFYMLARLPAFIFGGLAGFAMVSNFKRYNLGLIGKLKATIGTGAAFYFILYVCFGFSGFMKSDFKGALNEVDWYREGLVSLAIWWNSFIPNFLKNLRATDAMLAPNIISRFVLTSALIGTASAIVIPVVFRVFSPNKETYSYDANKKFHLLPSLAQFPYTVFQCLVEFPLSICASYGHLIATRVRRFSFSSAVYFIMASALGIGISFCLSKGPSVFGIQSQEITYLLGTVFAYTPIILFFAGFAIGLVPVLGDSVLFHLFDSKPDGVKVLGEKKPHSSGFLLGDGGERKSFFLTENNLAYHVEIVAPTGSGKTNILKNLIEDRIAKGHGVIFLDYKADFEVLNWMYRVAKVNNRTDDLRLISLTNPEFSVPYNPLEEGTGSELTSRLMNSFEWSSEQYYLNAAKSALSRVFRGFVEYRELTKAPFHVGHIHRALTDPHYLRLIAAELKANKMMYSNDLFEVAEKIEKPSDAKEIRGLISNLESLMFSSIGSLLTTDTEQGSYSLKEAIGEGKITYCLMNSLLLKESSRALGKLFLQDLMSFVGRRFATIERAEDHNKPVTLIIDEFAAFAIPEFVDFLDRARSAGIGVIIAHQDRADLKSISEEFQSRVEANTNTTIISGVKDPKDAEHFAGMLGTKTTIKETWQETSGFFGDTPTGMKSKRAVEGYVIHPNRIKELKQGEVLSISRTVDTHFGIVWVPRAREFNEVVLEKSELVQYFKASRARYLKESGGNAFSTVGLKSNSKAVPGLRIEEAIKKPVQPKTSIDEVWS